MSEARTTKASRVAALAGVAGLAIVVGCGSRTGVLLGSGPDEEPIEAGTIEASASEGGVVCEGATGTVLTLASNQPDPTGLVIDATHAYFASGQDPLAIVAKVPLCGGVVTTLASGLSPYGYPPPFAGNSGSLYWLNAFGSPTDRNAALLGVSKSGVGGAPVTLATFVDLGSSSVAADDEHVYVAAGTCMAQGFCGGSGGAIVSMPVGGGALVTLATDQADPTDLTLDATHVYWLAQDSSGRQAVASAPIAGGAVTTLLSGLGNNSITLMASSGRVYFWDPDGALVSVDAAGAKVARVPVAPDPFISIWTVDATTFYWATPLGRVESMPLSGGTPVTLSSDTNVGPGGIVVDSMSLYWTGQNEILRLTPK